MTDKNKKMPPSPQPEYEDLNVLMVRRREELDQLKQMGINPYPAAFSGAMSFSQSNLPYSGAGPTYFAGVCDSPLPPASEAT